MIRMPRKEDVVCVFTLGGTIDKEYSVAGADLVVGEPFLEKVLSSLRLQITCTIENITEKDSLDLCDSDRDKLCVAVNNSQADRIMVTHGTDTMIETAQYLRQHLDTAARNKTVVFTGAFVPGRFSSPEATFNLGFALAIALTYPAGAYIALGGCVYPSDSAMKDSERQCFDVLPS